MNLRAQINFAWHNLWRNRRRSLVTLSSLAFGFAAIALFAGYTRAIYSALSVSSVHGEGVGHITIMNTDWETLGKLYPDKYLLTVDEINKITGIVHSVYPDAYVIPKMSISGLLSNSRNSTVFVATGIQPEDERILRGPFRDTPGGLNPEQPSGVILAQGLADILSLKEGDGASVLTSTIRGQINAADVDVVATTNTGVAATNEILLHIPLALVRSLLDANDRADTLTILLPQLSIEPDKQAIFQTIYTKPAPGERQMQAICDQLTPKFKAAGLDVKVETWQKRSNYYTQVKTMFDMIFVLMFGVVLAIVALSIANAMSMAVVERTREIGTLRAMGMRRHGVVALFVSEALLLVIVGMAAGVVLATLVRWGVNMADIRYEPPGNTLEVPIYIAIDTARTTVAAILLAFFAVGAAFIPARRAARQKIPDSLGHV